MRKLRCFVEMSSDECDDEAGGAVFRGAVEVGGTRSGGVAGCIGTSILNLTPTEERYGTKRIISATVLCGWYIVQF